jgi:hypothetical protein
MKRLFFFLDAGFLAAMTMSLVLLTFYGFYVANADAQLFNRASQVVLVRHDDKTVVTMANDFQGGPTEFAIVIPVPTFIQEGQLHVTNKAHIVHLNAFSAPGRRRVFRRRPLATCLRG